MTKIVFGSDLHIDMGLTGIDTSNPDGADVLILAGDVGEVGYITTSDIALEFFNKLSDSYRHVIWILGNHEFYYGQFYDTRDLLESWIFRNDLNNITILENEIFELQDSVIFGGTLWTSIDNENPLSMMRVQGSMNDYYNIYTSWVDTYGSKPKLRPEDTIAAHKISRDAMVEFIKTPYPGKKKIIVTHHAPSSKSVNEVFRDRHDNGAYYSPLDHLFESEHCDVDFYIHGHMHIPSEYILGDHTQLMTFPRGYEVYEIPKGTPYSFKELPIND